MKTKIINKKFVKYLKRHYPTEFVDPTQNHNKMIGIANRQFCRKKFVSYFKSKIELKVRVVATRQNLQVDPKSLKNYQPIKTKKKPKKKYAEYLKSEIELKIRKDYRGYLTEFAREASKITGF
jgi:hypothetical protein